jgi:hypothetical protein
MAICVNSCNDSVIEHIINACNDFKLGDSPALGLIFCDDVYSNLSADFADNALWVTATTDPNDAVIIRNVTVSRTSEISEQENPVANGEENYSDGITYTMTITDPNVSCENHDFYRRLNGRKAYIAVAYNDGRMEVSETPFTIYSKLPSIEKGSTQLYEITASRKFTKGKSWLCFDEQPAIFS